MSEREALSCLVRIPKRCPCSKVSLKGLNGKPHRGVSTDPNTPSYYRPSTTRRGRGCGSTTRSGNCATVYAYHYSIYLFLVLIQLFNFSADAVSVYKFKYFTIQLLEDIQFFSFSCDSFIGSASPSRRALALLIIRVADARCPAWTTRGVWVFAA